jgi:hypothetical protein
MSKVHTKERSLDKKSAAEKVLMMVVETAG